MRSLQTIQRAIGQAARSCHRDPADISLIGASKTVPAADVEPFIEAGLELYGENRVQEARAKWPALIERHPAVRLHLIGPLQSNKAREAVSLFDAIHSLDRDSLIAPLAREFDRQDRRPELFIQVNIGREPQKSGILPEQADDLVRACRDAFGDRVVGLMAIPPADAPPSGYFKALAGIAGRNGLMALSMGMSSDYAEAIAHGATHVRVGSALFGDRL